MASRRLRHVPLTTLLSASLLVGLTPGAHSEEPPDEAVREEIVALRTETAKFFREPDGTHQAEIFPAPIHFLASDGRWEDIDPTLVASSDPGYAWRNAAGAVAYEFAPSVRSGDTVRVVADGEHLQFGPVGDLSPQPAVVAGNQVTYPGILPGVDLRYTVQLGGLKEEFVLHQVPAVPGFAFEASGTLSVSPSTADGFDLVNSAGEAVLRMPPLVMYESETPEHHEARASTGVTLTIEPGAGTQLLTLTFDPVWLADPTRRWPVFVDPSTQTLYPGSDTLVHRCYPNQNFNTAVNGNNQDLRSGSYGSCENDGSINSVAQTLMKFSHSGFGSTTIVSADLKMYNYYSSSCTARQTQVRRVTEGWGVNNVTWNNRPASTSSGMATASFAYGRSGCDSNGAWVQWDIANMFRGWVNGTWSNHGVLVLAADGTDPLTWRRYRSMEYGSGQPRLVVTYNGAPNTPTVQSPANNTVSSDNTPNFSATYSDPDGDQGYSAYEVRKDDAGSTLVVSGHCQSVNSNATSTWPGSNGACTHSSITLTDGRFKWRARNYDGSSYSAWTAYRYYTVDTTPPAAPAVTSTTHPTTSTWYSRSDITLDWTADDDAPINGYSYLLDTASDTTPPDTSLGTGTTASYSQDSGEYWFHVKARNGVNMWGTPAHRRVRVDVDAPTDPVIDPDPTRAPEHTSHAPYVPSADPTVTVCWLASSDEHAGILGYSWAFNDAQGTEAASTPDGDANSGCATSASLQDGTYWFHVKGLDSAIPAHASNDVTYGPIVIDANGPPAPVVVSPTHSQDEWSADRTAVFAWTPPADSALIEGYSVSFSPSENSDPDDTIDANEEQIDTIAPSWTEPNVGDGEWHFRVKAKYIDGGWSVPSVAYRIRVDGTTPAAPTINSATHPDPEAWVSNNAPEFTVSATATSDIEGYEYVIDQQDSDPSSPVPTVNSNSPNPSYPDTADGLWYLHARAKTGSGLWSDWSEPYLVRVDVTPPDAPTVTSPDHNTSEPTSQQVITADWTDNPGSDETSGIDGYAFEFNQSQATAPAGPPSTAATTAQSSSLADGVWYFHVVAVDQAGNRSDDAVFGPVTISQDAPPIQESRVQEFIDLWVPRVESTTFGHDYVYGEGYPQAILDEGFHEMNSAQKNYLIDRLNAVVYDPPVGDSAAENQAFRDMLYLFVFEKDSLRDIDDLDEWLGETVERLANTGDQTPQIIQNLEATELPTLPAGLPGPQLPDVTVPQLRSGLVPLPDLTGERRFPDLSADTAGVVQNLTTPMTDPLDAVRAQLDGIAAQAGIEPPTTPVFPDIGDLTIPDVTYAICWRSVAQTQATCRSGPGGVLLPGTVGVPEDVDVTGDGTSDVRILFGSIVDEDILGGQAFELTMSRLAGSEYAGQALRAHVWVVYDELTIQKRLLLGYDGFERGLGLSDETTTRLTIKDVLAASDNDDVSAKYDVSHQNQTSRWALTFGAREFDQDLDDQDETDPTDVSLQFSPVPGAIWGDVDHTRMLDATSGATIKQLRVTSHVTQPPPGPTGTRAVLDAVVNQVRSADDETARTRLLMNALPSNADVQVRQDHGGTASNTLLVAIESDQTIARVSVARQVTVGSVETRLYGDARSVPSDASLTVIDSGHRADATYQGTGSVDSIAIAASRTNDGVLARALSLAATDLPTNVTAGYGAPTSGLSGKLQADYSSNAPLTSLDVSFYRDSDQLTIVATADDVPTDVDATLDFAENLTDLWANDPVGLLDIKASIGGQLLYVPSGQHATAVIGTNTDASASVRIAGLTSINARYGDDLVADTSVVPGGQPFLLAARSGDARASARMSDVPSTLHVEILRSALTASYRATSRIGTLTVHANDSTVGPTLEATLVDVPREVDVTAQLGDEIRMTYGADAVLGSIDFLYNTEATATDDSGTRLYGSIADLPTTVTTTANLPGKSLSVSANQPVGRVTGVFTRGSGAPHIPNTEHASFVKDDQAIGASIDISGLESFNASYGDITDGSLVVGPGGQAFRLMGSVDGTLGYATFTKLPATTRVVVDVAARNALYVGDPAATRITAYGSKPDIGTLQVDMHDVPTRVEVTGTLDPLTGGTVVYTSPGSLGQLAAVYSPDVLTTEPATGSGRYVGVSAQNLPATVTATLDLAGKRFDWEASAATTNVTLRARNYPIAAAGIATVSDVPAHWNAFWDTSQVNVQGLTGQLGEIAFAVRNDGQPVLPAGNGLRAHANVADGLYDIGARLTNLTTVDYQHTKSGWKLTGDSDLEGALLWLDLDAAMPADAQSDVNEIGVFTQGSLSRFPSLFEVKATEESMTYTSNSNIDLALDVRAGWLKALANTATPTWRHGLSVRDGSCSTVDGCRPVANFLCRDQECFAVKSRLLLFGVASSIVVDFTTTGSPVRINNYAPPPSLNYLELYVDLREIVDLPTVFFRQEGIPSPVDLAFGPFSAGGDPAQVHVETHHSAGMGSLVGIAFLQEWTTPDESVLLEDLEVAAVVSSVPADLILDVGFGRDSSVNFGVSSPIDSVILTAVANFTSTSTGAANEARAAVGLFDIPASLDVNGAPEIHVDVTHPPTGEKPPAPTGESDPFLTFETTPCNGESENPQTPTGAGSGRGLDSLPTIDYRAPTSTVDLGIIIDDAWIQFAAASVDLTLQDAALALIDVGAQTAFRPTENGTGIRIASDDAVSTGRTGLIWAATSFDLRVPCLDLRIPERSHFGQKWSGEGKLDDTRIRIDDLHLWVTDVGHLTLSTGKAYLAYGVEGNYGTFDLYAPSLTATSHSWFNMRVERGFGFGVLPDWFNETITLDSPEDPNDPDDFENGWHTLYAHEMEDSFGPSKLSLCPQVGPIKIAPCLRVFTRPNVTGLRENGVHFAGTPGAAADTRNVFTLLDPGSSDLFTAVLDPLTALALTPDGYDTNVLVAPEPI
ncbi:MAG TPA: DNRLRE domain-containing protein [Actinomycetota bacterium]